MQVIYYNKLTNHTVVDVSARKGPEKIKEEFGDGFDDVLVIDEAIQSFTIEDDKLKIVTT